MASQSLTWNGAAITERMRAAQKLGVNATMSRCVVHAKSNHSWKNRTGVLEGSIDIADFAAVRGLGVEGRWGSKDVVYARIHELGGTITAKNGQALKIPMPDGSFRFVKSVTIRPRPYLRPAGDAIYPTLAANIKAAFEKSGGGSGAPQGGLNGA